jgi:Flp pilus assembly protein TadG
MIRRFLKDRSGAAAAEFVLTLPIMFALMFGAMEAGHYFWTQHKIVKAVRDGTRYATRLDALALCDSGAFAALETQIQNVTVTGQVADGGVPKVPGWSPSTVVVTPSCNSFVNTGIYADLGSNGPLVTVSAGNVAYPSILAGLGFIDGTFTLSAKSSAAVTGI